MSTAIIYALDPSTRPEHDYDPAWDYDLNPCSAEDQARLGTASQRILADILPPLGFQGFTVFTATLPGDCVAIYASGTAPFPVIGIDFERLKTGVVEHDLDLDRQIAISLAHELGHAHQDMCGLLDDEHNHDHNEDPAERFARDWVDHGIVDPTILD